MLKNILISKLFDIKLLDLALGKFTLNQAQKNILDEKLKLLNAGAPLDYLIGKVTILNLDLIVNQNTLIPREETENWLVRYVNEVKASDTLVDLGTGTGIIGLYLNGIYQKVYLLDVDKQTLKVAQQNIDLNAKNNCKTLLSNGLTKVETVISKDEKWDLVANLPYLPSKDIPKAKEHKVEYEPAIALYSGKDGLELFNSVLKQIKIMKNKPINILFELDPRNIKQAQVNLQKLDYQTEIWFDQNGLERVLVGVVKMI